MKADVLVHYVTLTDYWLRQNKRRRQLRLRRLTLPDNPRRIGIQFLGAKGPERARFAVNATTGDRTGLIPPPHTRRPTLLL